MFVYDFQSISAITSAMISSAMIIPGYDLNWVLNWVDNCLNYFNRTKLCLSCRQLVRINQLPVFQISPSTSTRVRQISRQSDDETVDCVSPSHSISNLRLIKFGKVKNESPAESDLRLRRIAVQEWNHNYWLKNNQEFQKVFHLNEW